MTAAAFSHPVTVPAVNAKILGLLVSNCLSHGRFRRFKRGGKTANYFVSRSYFGALLTALVQGFGRCRRRRRCQDMERQRGVRDPLRMEMSEGIERGQLYLEGTSTTAERAAWMTTPILTPRQSSSTVVIGLYQQQEDRANDDPHGRTHNGDPEINTHGGSHCLSGDGSSQ